jgi:hypothetical protein
VIVSGRNGSCDADQMAAIEEALRVWLDLR